MPVPPRRSRTAAALLSLPAVALLGACHSPDPAHHVRGPLPLRMQHPVALTFLGLRPRRAVVEEPGHDQVELDLAYSSIFEFEREPGQSVRLDGETARLSGRWRRAVARGVDLELELAAFYATSGFLDDFVDDFHDTFDLPQAGRDDHPTDQYTIQLRRNGEVIYELEEDRVGFGDVPVIATWQLRREDERGPAVAVRAGIELPTGSESRGYGNGGLDVGGGVLVEKSLGRWTTYGSADVILPQEPEAWDDADVEANEILQLGAGGEYRWNDRLSLLAQLLFSSSMTDDYDVEEFGSDILIVALGCAYGAPGGTQLYFAFKEDALARSGPDFGVTLGARWGF